MSADLPEVDTTAAVRAVRASIAENLKGIDQAMESIGGRADVFATVLLVATTRLVETLASEGGRTTEDVLAAWEADLRRNPPL